MLQSKDGYNAKSVEAIKLVNFGIWYQLNGGKIGNNIHNHKILYHVHFVKVPSTIQ